VNVFFFSLSTAVLLGITLMRMRIRILLFTKMRFRIWIQLPQNDADPDPQHCSTGNKCCLQTTDLLFLLTLAWTVDSLYTPVAVTPLRDFVVVLVLCTFILFFKFRARNHF
jgi:hypothetical protein